MSRKLTYSRAGFLRRVKMSYHSSLWLIVEGKTIDPYLAEHACRTSTKISSSGYQILLINQIANEAGEYAGGKSAILDFYEYCKSHDKLQQVNRGGSRSIAFLLDRDTQHITGGLRRSQHINYTLYADAEAHVFSESDELKALMVAASLDNSSCRALLKSLGNWKRKLADDWRPWIELCYVAGATGSSCRWVGMGHSQSRIHTGWNSRKLDPDLLAQAKLEVKANSNLDSEQYSIIESRVLARLDRIYATGDQTKLLKGKWLAFQLTHLVESYWKDAKWSKSNWHSQGFATAITRCYVASLKSSGPGTTKLRRRLEDLC